MHHLLTRLSCSVAGVTRLRALRKSASGMTRIDSSLGLICIGRAKHRLLFTGGASPFRPGQPPEGQLYLEEAEQLGIPAAAMQSTPSVVNTAQEAVAIRQLLNGSDRSTTTPRILLVTSAFHMRRAQRLLERQGLNLVPFPVDFHARGQWAGPILRDPPSGFKPLRLLMAVSELCMGCLGDWFTRPGSSSLHAWIFPLAGIRFAGCSGAWSARVARPCSRLRFANALAWVLLSAWSGWLGSWLMSSSRRASLMETKPVSESQLQLVHHGCLHIANRAADVVDWNREELVDHELGSFA